MGFCQSMAVSEYAGEVVIERMDCSGSATQPVRSLAHLSAFAVDWRMKSQAV